MSFPLNKPSLASPLDDPLFPRVQLLDLGRQRIESFGRKSYGKFARIKYKLIVKALRGQPAYHEPKIAGLVFANERQRGICPFDLLIDELIRGDACQGHAVREVSKLGCVKKFQQLRKNWLVRTFVALGSYLTQERPPGCLRRAR